MIAAAAPPLAPLVAAAAAPFAAAAAAPFAALFLSAPSFPPRCLVLLAQTPCYNPDAIRVMSSDKTALGLAGCLNAPIASARRNKVLARLAARLRARRLSLAV